MFNPITIFGLLFFAFGIKNLISRNLPSAIAYLVLSLCICLGGAWLLGVVAVSHGPKPFIEQANEKGPSNQASQAIGAAAPPDE